VIAGELIEKFVYGFVVDRLRDFLSGKVHAQHENIDNTEQVELFFKVRHHRSFFRTNITKELSFALRASFIVIKPLAAIYCQLAAVAAE
jgi:hypothetical protein